MSAPSARRVFVHLAYLDDSDTKAKPRKWQVMSGVVVEDHQFPALEIILRVSREELIPPEKIDKFEEFHASELYGGYGVFEGIDQEKRFDTIRGLLRCLTATGASIIYGAVDLDALQTEVYASAEPLDIAFRACIKGIRECMRKAIHNSADSAIAGIDDPIAKAQAYEEALKSEFLTKLAILVVDDFSDKKTKELLSKSFRRLRGQELSHFHDDMYFGDSRYSIGIQLADLCSYFIARHLEGDSETAPFYEMIRPHLVFSETHPKEEAPQFNSLAALLGEKAPDDK
jgi:hypothetical protein